MNRFVLALTRTIIASQLCLGAFAALAEEPKEDGLHIAPQPLATALREFSEQTGLQVGYPSEIAEGKSTDGVEGIDDPALALETLLASSGLQHTFVNDQTVVIQAAAADPVHEGGDSDSGNAPTPPTPTMMAQASVEKNRNDEVALGSSDTDTPAAVTGKVTDRRTGSGLPGALVRIPEIGREARTDDSGAFRFPSVAPGEYSVTVSYLGYERALMRIRLQSGQGAEANFALGGAHEIDEIMVFGSRSARALALNQERTADNSSTVISSDLLGKFDGTTIAEALRRASGVSFQPDPETGDGANIIVRGLAPDLNTVKLNGLRLAVGNGLDRSPTLNNILADSVAKVTISKSLLPSQDSSGTGGLVEIETKGPLDRPRRYASFGIEDAQTGEGILNEYLLSATVSGTFGSSENFGMSVSAQHRDREVNQYRYGLNNLFFGQYLPLDDNGMPVTSSFFISPQVPFPFEPGTSEVYPNQVSNTYYSVDVKDISLTAAAQWQIENHTDLRLDYVRANQLSDIFSRTQAIRASNSTYELLPVDELGGETRAALVWEQISGPSIGTTLFAQQTYRDTRDIKDSSHTLSLTGISAFGNWEADYRVGYATAKNVEPAFYFFNVNANQSGSILIDSSFLESQALSNTINGRLVSPFGSRSGRGYALPLLNESGFAYLNDPSNYQLTSGDLNVRRGRNDRYTTEFSLRRNFNHPNFKYFEGGVFFESSRSENHQYQVANFSAAPGTSLDTFGLSFNDDNLSRIGIDGGFNLIGEAGILNLADNLGMFTSGASPSLFLTNVDVDDAEFSDYTRENALDAYFQARIELGRFEVIGGARVEKVNIIAASPVLHGILLEDFTLDPVFASMVPDVADLKGKQTDIIPRILANYRWTDKFVTRVGFFTSVARPSISQLNSQQLLVLFLAPVFGPNGNQPQLLVNEGNPNLRPSYTDNYDFSLEYYDENMGAIKISAFYKDTKDIIFSNTTQPVEGIEGIQFPDYPTFQNLPDNLFVSGSRPENSPHKAHLWGVETSFEKQLTFLPGFWDGLGVYANYTYTNSSKTEAVTYFSPSFELLQADIRCAISKPAETFGNGGDYV
jgi:TonB-dependent receptor